MHIDGVSDFSQLQSKVDEKLSIDQRLCKQVVIKQSLKGPQTKLQEFKETYNAHNPISAEDASFSYFVSIGLNSSTTLPNNKKKQEAIDYVASWMAIISSEEKIALEVERVIAKIDYYGKYNDIDNGRLTFVGNTEFDDFAKIINKNTFSNNKRSKDCEIHHYLDFDKDNVNQQPIELIKLLDLCNENDITVGGWFVFDSKNEWLFRSNLFADKTNAIEIAKTQDRLLRTAISNRFKNVRIKTVVEHILGIWKFGNNNELK